MIKAGTMCAGKNVLVNDARNMLTRCRGPHDRGGEAADKHAASLPGPKYFIICRLCVSECVRMHSYAGNSVCGYCVRVTPMGAFCEG